MGLNEELDEYSFDQGLVVRGKHWVILGDRDNEGKLQNLLRNLLG
jgi:hypothetical protein